ncbi:MAG TPA: hypothetical protein DCE09_03775 [Thermoanaerobacter sp.]|nr:hypothetical protein [Thermoanaerobacter sp.]
MKKFIYLPILLWANAFIGLSLIINSINMNNKTLFNISFITEIVEILAAIIATVIYFKDKKK